MLYPLRAKSPLIRVSTPDLFVTRAVIICFIVFSFITFTSFDNGLGCKDRIEILSGRDHRQNEFVLIYDTVDKLDAFCGERFTDHLIDILITFKAEAFSADGPVLVDCRIGIDEKVLPMIAPGKSFDSIITKM